MRVLLRSWKILPLAVAAGGLGFPAAGPAVAAPQDFNQHKVRMAAGALPAFFTHARDGFRIQTGDLSVRLHAAGLDFARGGSLVRQRFEAPRQALAPESAGRLGGKVNYLIGNDPKLWEIGLSASSSVVYRQIYPGIDLSYRAEGKRLKSEYVVHPGADIARIAWRYEGAHQVRVAADGSIRISTLRGELVEHAPQVFQTIGGRRVTVGAGYSVSGKRVRYDIGDYDRSQPLIIDPVISFSSYLGGNRNENATSVAVDASGSAYVTGWTESANFPLASPYRTYSGSVDAFVVKFNPAGNGLVYSTYLGGSGDDRGLAIAVDGAGKAYVAGSTASSNFPTFPAQSGFGLRDAFAAVLLADGSGVSYSQYFGGAANDAATGIAVDVYGQFYVAGETESTTIPLRLPYQSSPGGRKDGFVFKISPVVGLVFSTFFGGSGDDRPTAIAISADTLTPYLAGCTDSPNLPLRTPAQGSLAGGQDAFIVRFNGDANDLIYSTYLGGAAGGSAGGSECASGIAADTFHNAYVTGSTPSVNFPVLGPFQTQNAGGTDAFVAKLNSGGALLYSSFLGGRSADFGTAIQVDINRRAYVVGYTASRNFPIVASTQASLGGSYDAFAVRVDTAGSVLNFSTYLGGYLSDTALGAAYHANGDLYVVGGTSSTNFPVVNPFRATSGGFVDAFLTKIGGAGF